jgi:hypothetical protein
VPIAVLRPDSSGSFSEVKLADYDITRYAPALGASGIGASMNRRSVVSVQSDNPAPTYADRGVPGLRPDQKGLRPGE